VGDHDESRDAVDVPRDISDVRRADELFTLLMAISGPRREFIEQNAKLVADLDI
jgi:DNA gyrase/topoisomerase IV subunit B